MGLFDFQLQDPLRYRPIFTLIGAQTLSKGISNLISKTELTKKDRLNLKSLERRLLCITQPLNHSLMASTQRPMGSSLQSNPIEQSASLIEEIIGFITRVNTTPNFVFDEEFSVELEHYCKELEFLVQALQLAININREFSASLEAKGGLQADQVSMSAFIRASHRMRSMSLVSGYVLTQKGSLLAKVSYSKGRQGAAVSKWIKVIDSGELNVVFHPKFGRFQIDVISSEEQLIYESRPSKRAQKQPLNASTLNDEGMMPDYFDGASQVDIETHLKSK